MLTGAHDADVDRVDPRPEVLRAYAPYALIVAVFSIAQLGPVKELLGRATLRFDWPFLDAASADGERLAANAFALPLLATGGTLVLLAGLGTARVLRVPLRAALGEWLATVRELRAAIVTVTSVLALAYVMNLSGQAPTIGHSTWGRAAPSPGWPMVAGVADSVRGRRGEGVAWGCRRGGSRPRGATGRRAFPPVTGRFGTLQRCPEGVGRG